MRGSIVMFGVALALVATSGANAADPAVATVGARTITRAELEEHVRSRLMELENERYEALREGLDEMVADELVKQEAKARGVTVEALEAQEVTAKVTAPTDADVQKFFDENKEQLGGRTLEQVKPNIVEYLKQERAEQRQQAFLGELKAKYKTTVALRPPVVNVETAGRPEKGGPKAPVTIVEFSDYQCPYCKRGEDVIDKVVQTYGDKVKVVFRDFPLPMHPDAHRAAQAAACANAQGKFWPYHAKLFANQTALGDDKLKAYATELGLDATKFNECLAQGTFKAAVDKDIADGTKVGVSGTPAFFINGRMLSGAQPFEKFKEVIDEELASPAAPAPTAAKKPAS